MSQIPTSSEIVQVPLWGQVALAARWARRAACVFMRSRLVHQKWASLIDEPLSYIEELAAAAPDPHELSTGKIRQYSNDPIPDEHYQNLNIPWRGDAGRAYFKAENATRVAADAAFYLLFYGSVENEKGHRDAAEIVADRVERVATLAREVGFYLGKCAESVAEDILLKGQSNEAIKRAIEVRCAAKTSQETISRFLRADYNRLQQEAAKNQWTALCPIPKGFFPSFASFNNPEGNNDFFGNYSSANDKLTARISECPKRLYDISPREFEELIASVYQEFGFDVELTKRTRDGGFDVVAVRYKPEAERYLIECKRYSEDNKVDVSLVRQLAGVVTLEKATKGIFVTTSHFTKPAME